nr:LEF-9 protein [Oryctes rhinoceros nudivirus]
MAAIRRLLSPNLSGSKLKLYRPNWRANSSRMLPGTLIASISSTCTYEIAVYLPVSVFRYDDVCTVYISILIFSTFADVVCHLNNNVFTKDVTTSDMILHEHIYNTKNPCFFFCFTHSHFHKSHPTLKCIIQEFKCCDDAVSVKDFDECFTITTLNARNGPINSAKKQHEYIIFDPSIWREQSYNHFMSLVRAVILSPNDVPERYKRFESSNFTISNIKPYISGKESIIRTMVTGFETFGIYQTSTISCTIPYYAVVLPTKMYDMLEADGFDLDLVIVKRDPSILQTCMYVCSVQRHADQVTMISDQQSKGMNQDQDGDRNAQYLIRKRYNGYDCTKSFDYKIAKMEMANAFRVKRTLIGTPRYILSETSMLKIKRFANDFMHLDFFRKTYKDGVRFMNEAAAGYLCEEYDEFQEALRLHTLNETPTYVTVDDILLNTDRLPSIVTSGAKGNMDLINLLLSNISNDASLTGKVKTLTDKKKDMLELCNKYITSSQDLSRNGRKQFAALYAAHDLVSLFQYIFINKQAYADYSRFASAGTFLFNKATLELFVRDLKAL